MVDAGSGGGIAEGLALGHLGVEAGLERRRHGEHAGHAVEQAVDRGPVGQIGPDELDAGIAERPRLLGVGVTGDAAHGEAACAEVPYDGAALRAGRARDEDGSLLT